MRKLTLRALACALVLGACALSETREESPAPRSALLLELEQTFPATQRWFGMVADLELDTSAGEIVPRYDTLHSPLVLARDGGGQSIEARLPDHARGPHTVAVHGAPGLWVRTREQGIADVEARIESGVVVYAGAIAGGGDLLYKLTPTHVDEYVYLRTPPETLTRTFVVETGPAVAALRPGGAHLEVLDGEGTARLRLGAPLARAADGTRRRGTLRVDGDRLVLEIDLRGLAAPILIDPDWSTTGTMTVGHWADTAWRMSDGRVMAVAGCALSGCPSTFARSACGQVLADTEVWTEASGLWSAGPPLATARFSFGGVSIGSGDYLVAGGCTTTGCDATTASAEVYRAAAGGWQTVGALPHPVANVMAAALPGGDALVAGGCDESGCVADAQRFGAASGVWASVGPLAAPRGFASATALPDGRVLVVGGCADPGCASVLSTAELYDPSTGLWSPAGTMAEPRAGHTASALGDGSVLVLGGCADAACMFILPTVEIWSDAGGGSFSPGPTMLGARHNHTATTLDGGELLVAGGGNGAAASLPSAMVYLPGEARWVELDAMNMDRAYHVAVTLSSGRVLLGGGCNPTTCMPWAEVYDPATLPFHVVDGGVPPIDAGLDASSDSDAGDAAVFRAEASHPAAYRTGASRCATNTAQQLPCPVEGYPRQDADYVPDARSLTLSTEGDVTDANTGLSWQAGDDGRTYDLGEARAHCATLAPAGTWRLPSVVELASIVDYGVHVPSLDPLFGPAPSTNYWSATPVTSGAEQNWTVRFDFGEVIPMGASHALPVRCVRGEPISGTVPGHVRRAGALVATGPTVRDEATGLEWQRTDDGVRRDWRGALEHCARLDLAGHADWHLPNVAELTGIVEYGGAPAGAATIDRVFTDARPDLYWTSTPNDGAPTLSWSVSFNLGVVDGVTTSGITYARCVRHIAPPRPAPSGCGCRAGERRGGAIAVIALSLVLAALRRR